MLLKKAKKSAKISFMIHVLEHAFIDSIKLLPVLFLTYVLIEVIEKFASPHVASKFFSGKLAPLICTTAGLIPQCGLSVIATNLYSKRFIALGTLLAVYLSTSDEAIPILLSTEGGLKKIIPFILIKFFVALLVGYFINFLMRKRAIATMEEEIEVVGCHNHEIGHKQERKFSVKTYIFHPLVHTFTVFFFIFLVNLFFGSLIHYIGENKIANFMGKVGYLEPVLAGLVGLIPNCASSVIITQMYALGQLGLGGVVSGLCANAGLGLAVLFRQNKNLKENFLIILLLYVLSVLTGTLTNLVQNLI